MTVSGLVLRAGVGPTLTPSLLVLRGLSPGEVGVGIRAARHSISPVPLRRTRSPIGDSSSNYHAS